MNSVDPEGPGKLDLRSLKYIDYIELYIPFPSLRASVLPSQGTDFGWHGDLLGLRIQPSLGLYWSYKQDSYLILSFSETLDVQKKNVFVCSQ